MARVSMHVDSHAAWGVWGAWIRSRVEVSLGEGQDRKCLICMLQNKTESVFTITQPCDFVGSQRDFFWILLQIEELTLSFLNILKILLKNNWAIEISKPIELHIEICNS